mmetsp:Transcript_7596/g.13438  ORF Transcript_7596/g.13438 Transcript_7596/m.13438 type:complete len:209 (+) Transcript_7596:1748-2374(+)
MPTVAGTICLERLRSLQHSRSPLTPAASCAGTSTLLTIRSQRSQPHGGFPWHSGAATGVALHRPLSRLQQQPQHPPAGDEGHLQPSAARLEMSAQPHPNHWPCPRPSAPGAALVRSGGGTGSKPPGVECPPVAGSGVQAGLGMQGLCKPGIGAAFCQEGQCGRATLQWDKWCLGPQGLTVRLWRVHALSAPHGSQHWDRFWNGVFDEG